MQRRLLTPARPHQVTAWSRRALLFVAAASTLFATAGVSASAQAAPLTPYSVMTLIDPAGILAPGGHASYDLTNSSLAVSGDLTFTATMTGDPTSSATVAIQPPTTASSFAVGHYTTKGSPDAGAAGLRVTSHGQQCFSDGTLDVLSIDIDPGTQAVTSFAADYTVTCYGTLSGVLRWNSSTGNVDASVAAPVSLGTVYEGTTTAAQDATLTNWGTDDLKVSGAATVASDNADDEAFAITNDACSGVTLSAGQSCVVSVDADPMLLGQVTGTLSIPDNAPGGASVVRLTVNSSDPAIGNYFPTAPTRILDTRSGAVKPARTIHLQVSGRGGVPASGVTAVVLNLTVTRETANSGYVTAFPTGKPRPTASSLNYVKAVTLANSVTVPLGTGGRIDLFNSSGVADLLVDVTGWYAGSNSVIAASGAGDSYQPLLDPVRILDTRADGPSGTVHDAVPAGADRETGIAFDGLAETQIHALAVTVTGTNVKRGGYLTAFSGDTDPTKVSTLNLRPGVTTANLAIVPSDDDSPYSTIWVHNGSGAAVDVLVDLVGFYADDSVTGGLRFHALATPTRVVDTRIAQGTTKFGPATTHNVAVPASVAGPNSLVLSGNVTAVNPSSSTYLTLWPSLSGLSRPNVSNVNAAAGATVADGALVPMGDNNVVSIFNSSGRTDVLLDVAGTFDIFPVPSGAGPMVRSHAAPRSGITSTTSTARVMPGQVTRTR